MKPQQLREMLVQHLDDGQLSRSESSALSQIPGQLEPGGQQLANFRRVAVDLAHDVITPENNRRVLDWLEDVMRLLQPEVTKVTRPVRRRHTSARVMRVRVGFAHCC